MRLFTALSLACLAWMLVATTACEEDHQLVNTSPDPAPQDSLNPGPSDSSVVDSGQVDTTNAGRAPVQRNYTVDTAIPVQARRALIEDFTGVQCLNCPQAQERAAGIAKENAGRVSLVALHGEGFFNRPFNESRYDFRLPRAQAVLEDVLQGGDEGLPTGTVSRLPRENEVLYSYVNWGAQTEAVLRMSTPLHLELRTAFAEGDTMALLSLRGAFREAVEGNLAYSFYLTENDLIDYQKDGIEKIPDYEHDHVLRALPTPPSGKPLLSNPLAQRGFVREVRVAIEPAWVVANCHVVAFVHRTGIEKEVLQVVEAPLTDR
jgi:hypothetical protein